MQIQIYKYPVHTRIQIPCRFTTRNTNTVKILAPQSHPPTPRNKLKVNLIFGKFCCQQELNVPTRVSRCEYAHPGGKAVDQLKTKNLKPQNEYSHIKNVVKS